jgi:DNA-binding response OmpR family regulator/class 3 adenylate cyclase
LLVAAEVDLRARVARGLVSSGYAVELAGDDKRALALARADNFLVAIVAFGARPGSLAMLGELRDRVSRLIIFAELPEEIARLQRSLPGAEVIRLNKSNERAVIRRVDAIIAAADPAPPLVPNILYIEDYKLDLRNHAFLAADGREIALTRAEASLLTELARNPGLALSRDQLRRGVAGRSSDAFERSIDMVVTRLRRKIEPNPQLPRLLVTVPGVGYKLAARPQRTDVRQSQVPAAQPDKRPITVLACEPVGATELALKSDPEDLSRVIMAFQEAAISATRQMGGTIASVAPDQILALFGYPEAHEDDAERAVDAGLDVIAQISALSPPRSFQVRLGIASGLALATETQAIGEPSFVAIGLCDLASPNSMLVAASTRRLLGDCFVCENPNQYVLTGASDPLNACRVTGRRDVASRFKGKHWNTALRLIGRDQELRQLLALWNRAKAGVGQVALICGEAGIGKSHLCESFLQRFHKKSYATFRYQCSARHLNSPFYPVIHQLEHAMGFEQTDGPELKLKKLEAGLRHAAETSQEEIALYARLLSIAKPKSDAFLELTPQRQKGLTIAAICRRLQNLAAIRALIIVLADAHWIDSSTLELVDDLIPLIKTARALFVIEFRPEFSPRWLDEPHVTLLRLDRLGRDQSLAIISEVTEHKNLPSELEEHIISRADGVPLFIEELTKTAQELRFVKCDR